MDVSPLRADPVASFQDELEGCSKRARGVCSGLEAADLARRADRKRWSTAEHLEHLSLTTEAYLPLLESAARDLEARGLRADGPFRLDLTGRFLLWILEPPFRGRTKTTAPFVPAAIERPEAVLPRFLDLQGQLARRADLLRGLALDRHKVASPFNPRMRYSVWSCLKVLAAHQRRHLWTCEQARRAK